MIPPGLRSVFCIREHILFKDGSKFLFIQEEFGAEATQLLG